MNSYTSSQVFTWFDYQVGHQGLLLRANGNSDHEIGNVDLIFDGVTYVSLPTVLSGVEVSVDRSPENSILKSLNACPEDKVYLISSKGQAYFVVANSFIAIENNLSWHISSLGLADFEFKELFQA
jgi:hypothetical protein